jgi:hypothetical protein
MITNYKHMHLFSLSLFFILNCRQMNWAALKDLGITKEDLLHHYRYVHYMYIHVHVYICVCV